MKLVPELDAAKIYAVRLAAEVRRGLKLAIDDASRETEAVRLAAEVRRGLKRLTKGVTTKFLPVRLAAGTPYVIFEVIAALKVSNSLSVQQWSLRPAACAGVLPFNVPCFRHRL